MIDYSNIVYSQKKFKINESGAFVQETDEITFIDDPSNIIENYKILEFEVSDNSYHLNTKEIKDEDLYLILRKKYTWISLHNEKGSGYNKKKLYRLNEGDIFRMGKSIFKVRKIELGDSEYSSNQYISNMDFNSISNSDFKIVDNNWSSNRTEHIEAKSPERRNEKNPLDDEKVEISKHICRICYGNETTKNNPLFHPCNCTGSVGFIHYECLKNWLNLKMLDEDNDNQLCVKYKIQDNNCEICKSKFPDFINYKGKLFDISFYLPNYKKYILIEGCVSGHEAISTIYVINLEDNKKLSIGRSSESVMKVDDISVSRLQAFIYERNGGVWLEDTGSKFGTLVLLQNPNLEITPGLPLRLQYKRIYIKINLNPQFSFFSCCKPVAIDMTKEYSKQNKMFCDPRSKFDIVIIDKDPDFKEEANAEDLRKQAEERRTKDMLDMKKLKEKEKKEKKKEMNALPSDIGDDEVNEEEDYDNFDINDGNEMDGDDDQVGSLDDDFEVAGEINHIVKKKKSTRKKVSVKLNEDLDKKGNPSNKVKSTTSNVNAIASNNNFFSGAENKNNNNNNSNNNKGVKLVLKQNK